MCVINVCALSMNKQFSSFFCGPLPNQVLKNVFHAENDFAKINVLQATFFSIVYLST